MKLSGLNREISEAEVDKFVSENSEIGKWLQKIPSEYTKHYYPRALMRYCEAVDMSPAQLLALKKKSRNHDAEDLLDEFVAQAQRACMKNSMLWNVSKAVKSFYKWRYFDLAKAAGNIDRKQVRAYRVPNKESIHRFIEGLNIRDRTLVIFIAASGVAEGSIPPLKWRHIEDLDADIPHISLNSDMVKGHGCGRYAGLEQHTFLTPYAKRTLLDYRAWRERREKRVLGPEDFVFVTVEEPIGPLSLSAIRNMMDRHSKDIGLKFSFHDFRRFLQTTLEMAELQPNWIKKILRHKVKGEESPYSRPEIDKLRAAYRTAIPLLDLGVSTSPEIGKTVTTQQKEIKELRDQVNNLEKMIMTGVQLGAWQMGQKLPPEAVEAVRKNLGKAKIKEI